MSTSEFFLVGSKNVKWLQNNAVLSMTSGDVYACGFGNGISAALTALGLQKEDELAKRGNLSAQVNSPLTPDQLRQAGGQPVIVEEDGEYQYGLVSLKGHFLAQKEEVITLASGNFYLIREMEGNFKVYPLPLAAQENKATPGPWEADGKQVWAPYYSDKIKICDAATEPDAEIIARLYNAYARRPEAAP